VLGLNCASTAPYLRVVHTKIVYTIIVLPSPWRAVVKNVTFSADERLIEAARDRARSEHTTLNEEFRRWLEAYARREERSEAAMRVIADLRTRVRTGGRRFTRDGMHER